MSCTPDNRFSEIAPIFLAADESAYGPTRASWDFAFTSAVRGWARLTGELSKLNPITNLDRGALATYRGAYAMWAEAMEQIQKCGTMVKSPTGFPIQSPYLAIANRQAEIMMRIASEFGFTPASRSRIFHASQRSTAALRCC
jgi:P27 family predicted phage terminase small subunit